MKLLPSLRQKKRYLVFEVISEKDWNFSPKEVEDEVNQALQTLLGQLGIAKSAPLFIKEKCSLQKQRFILKINHQYSFEAKAALALIKTIKNIPVIVKSLALSGNLKKAAAYLAK